MDLLRATMISGEKHNECVFSEMGLDCEDCPLCVGNVCIMFGFLKPRDRLPKGLTAEKCISEIVAIKNNPVRITKSKTFMFDGSVSSNQYQRFHCNINRIYEQLPDKYKSGYVPEPQEQPLDRFSDLDVIDHE